MSPDDKLSDWASHAVAPDDPPEPSPDHLDSADDALTKLFGDEVTPDVTHSSPRPSGDADTADTTVAGAGASEPGVGDTATTPAAAGGSGPTGDDTVATGGVRIDADPVTGPLPIVAVDADADVDDEAPADGALVPVPPGDAGAGNGTDAERSRREQHKDWRRTEKARRLAARKSVRFPIFTRSVLLWMLIFALVGFAFGASGAFWWANFNKRVTDIEQSQDDFESRSVGAQAAIEQQKEQTLAAIDEKAGPVKALQAGAEMAKLAQNFAPMVYTVATLDDEGLASTGTAFPVIDDGGDAYFVTSYAVVKAATVEPSPTLTLRFGGQEVEAKVWNWDPGRDLALLKAPVPDVTLPDWVAGTDQAGRVGTSVFPVTAVAGVGAAVENGLIIDQSAAGFQHDAPIGAHFRGGPILDIDQKVMGVASLDYFPLGFDPGAQIHFAVSIDQVCQRLISCGGGGSKTPGAQGG